MERKSIVFGLILVVLGLLLLLKTLNIHVFSLFFPAALMIFGLWLIARHNRSKRPDSGPTYTTYTEASPSNAGPSFTTSSSSTASSSQSSATGPGQPGWSAETPQFESGKVKYSKFMGDMHIDCQNVNLQNVEISMFVGDLNVVLRGGKLSPGLNRMIISGFLGDVQILVPRDLPLFVHCSGFVGDVEVLGKRASGFGNTLDAQTDSYTSADCKLYIATNNFIGDIRVYPV